MSGHSRLIALFLICFSLLGSRSKAQDVVPSMGTDFWLGYMQNFSGMNAQSLDIFVSSYTATTGTVTMQGWTQNFNVVPGVTTTVTVPMNAMHLNSAVVENKGIRIETADTVAVFAINFEQYTADGTVVYPVQSLGTDYRIFSYPGIGLGDYKSEFLIVATEDDTEIVITCPVATEGGPAAGVPFTIYLDQGESYQLKALTAADDLTGSTIVGTEASGSCRPFAVFSGSVCTRVPDSCTACDHIVSQNLPRNVWGSTYFSVPFSSQSSYTYRIMADSDGTVVMRNGANPVNLNAGQFVEVNFEDEAICFTGNQPFCVAQYMEGTTCSGTGDPALLILNAAEQKIDNITFATVVSTVINSHFVNIIVDAVDAGEVYLDGVLIPPAQFNSFTGCPTSVYTTMPIAGGSHTLSCQGGLTGYIYGTGSAESYAYSVGSFTPVPPLNLDSVYCGVDINGNITLAAPVNMFDPFWTTLSEPEDTLHYGMSYTFQPVGSDVYVVTGFENVSGCETEYLFSVELDDPPALSFLLNGEDPALFQPVCAYSEVQLEVIPDPPGTYTYNWSPSASLNNGNISDPIASPPSTTWFSVVVSTLNGCAVVVDSIEVLVSPGNILSYDALTEKDALCLGDSSQLDLEVQQIIAQDDFDPSTGLMWTNINNGTANDICGSVTGNALYFDGNGNRFAQTVGLDVTAGGTVRFALKVANDVAPCGDAAIGQNILLEYSINGGGAWVLINTYFEYQYPVFTTIDAVIPPAAQTANTMFRWSQPVNGGTGLSNWMLDDIAIGVLNTDDLVLSWEDAATLSDATAVSPMSYPAQSGWYTVEIYEALNNCTYHDSVYIEVGEPFSIDLPADTAICDLAGIQLYAIPSSGTNHTWNWTPANGTLTSTLIQNPVATPTTTTQYEVTVVTGQGCEATDSVTITVNQLLGMNITTPDDELCQGETTPLNTAIVGNTTNLVFEWLPDNNSLSANDIASPIATPPTTTNYILTATDTLSGCVLVDSILITVSTLYEVTVTNDTMLCDVLGFQLDVQHNVPNGVISWTPAAYLQGANTATPTIIWPNTTEYIVEISDALGCSAKDTVNITAAFSDLVFYPDTSLCEGDEMVIDAGFPGSTYDWSTGATTQTITVSTPGDYTVTMTDAENCVTTFTTSVTIDPIPMVELGPDTTLCVGEVWTLNGGTDGTTYLWNTQATSQTINVSTEDLYWVEVTDANYCTNSDSIDLHFAPPPDMDLSDAIVCVSETITLDAGNPGSTYAWSSGETTQSIDVTAASGTYTVVVTTADLCVASDQATLTFIEFPVLDLGPDTALCDTESITLDAGNPTETFLWSTGSDEQTITLTTTHQAWVQVFNGYCTSIDTVEVLFNPLPVIDLADQIVCVSETITLDAGTPGSTYQWSTGATSQTIDVTAASDVYSVVVTTAANCVDSDQAELTFIDFPIVDIGPDTALCDTESITLNAGAPGNAYLWSNGSIDQSTTLTQSHVAWVDVFNGYCTTRDSAVVVFNPLPKEINKYQALCLEQPPYKAVLDAENEDCEFLWITSETTQSIEVTSYGLYSVLITTPLNCSITERVVIEEYCPPTIFIPNTFTPDGDGINDKFGPVGNNIVNLEMLIFNRWGELIFIGNDANAFWDGGTSSGPAQDGVYVWKLKYQFVTDVNGTRGYEMEDTGHVTLLR